MTVHSNQLGHAFALGTVETTLYTVPANHRTIFKGYSACNYASGANVLTLLLYRASTNYHFWHEFLTASATNGDTVNREIWMVLLAGDQIRAIATAADLTVVVSGSELGT